MAEPMTIRLVGIDDAHSRSLRTVASQLRGQLRRARLGDVLRSAVQQAPRDPAQVLFEREHAAAVLAALRDLPERQRELLTLTVWEGLPPG